MHIKGSAIITAANNQPYKRPTRISMFPFLVLISLFTLAKAVPQATPSSRCVGTISSLSDVNAAVQCTTVNINAFTVPAGETFSLDLLQGTTVNVCE